MSGPGRHRPLPRALLLTLLAATAPGSSARAEPARGDWLGSRGAPDNPGAATLALDDGRAPLAWTFAGDGRVWGYQPGVAVFSPPALGLVDGLALLLVGSYDHNLYALDAVDGSERWRFTTGGAVSAAPALWRDGDEVWAYAASADGLIYGLDARLGQRRWIHGVEAWRPTFGGARLGSPCLLVDDGPPLLVLSYWVWDRSLGRGQQESGLLALNARDGALRWRTPLGEGGLSAPLCVAYAGQRLVAVGGNDGKLSLLDAGSGQVRWQRTELDAVRGSAAFAVIDGEASLFYASAYGLLRRVRLDDGAERWHYKLADQTAGAPLLAPLAGRTLVVLGALDRTLHAVDAGDGHLVWRYGARAGFYESAAFVDDGAGGLIAATAWDLHLHGVRADDGQLRFLAYTGRPLWDLLGLQESAGSPPLLARLGAHLVVYLGSYSGVLYAFPVAALADLAPRRDGHNLRFWLSLPLAVGLVGGLARWLTCRQRARRAA